MPDERRPEGLGRDPDPVVVDPRVVFAAERTLLAWIRTAVALVALGFVVARFALVLREIGIATRSNGPVPTYIGIALVLSGGGLVAWASVDHARTLAALRRGAPLGDRRAPIVVGAFTVVVALALAAVLLFGGR